MKTTYLMSLIKKLPIEALQEDFINIFIREDDHFLQAVNISNQYQTNVIPVVNEERELTGSISGQTLLRTMEVFRGPGDRRNYGTGNGTNPVHHF